MTESEYNTAIINTLVRIKQNWPSLRTPTNKPEMNRITPIPPSINIKRITGMESLPVEEFLNSGYTDLVSVMNIAEVYGYSGGKVLDWGVGCGRMIRHLPDYIRLSSVCADVDPVNVKWMQDNTSISPCLLNPHGSFPDRWYGSIELLYSHSVMTHIVVEDQIHWLREINRVLCTDGLAIISVHGLYAVAKLAEWAKIPEDMGQWLEEGFKTSSLNNTDIIDVVPELYYQDTAHTPKFIQEVWGRYIDVVDIIPGGFGPFHDAVICKKKD